VNKDNIYENLYIKKFYDEYELLDDIIEKCNNLVNNESIGIISNSELINFLFIELIQADFNVGFIEFDNLDTVYYKEHILTIDSDKNIWIKNINKILLNVIENRNYYSSELFDKKFSEKNDLCNYCLFQLESNIEDYFDKDFVYKHIIFKTKNLNELKCR